MNFIFSSYVHFYIYFIYLKYIVSLIKYFVPEITVVQRNKNEIDKYSSTKYK